MDYKFKAEIKLNGPNLNGTLYTKDSFRQSSYDVPVMMEPGVCDIPIGKCHVDVKENKLLLDGNLITNSLKTMGYTPTIYSTVQNIDFDDDGNIIITGAQIKEIFFTENNAFKDCEINWDR